MKGLGLAGAGLAAGATTVPMFHDLSELATSPKATFKRPWFVKELDFKKASVEIDWSIFQAWDSGPYSQWYPPEQGGAYEKQVGYKHRLSDHEYLQTLKARQLDIMQNGLDAGTPGFALRDTALRYGAEFNTFGPYYSGIPFTGEDLSPYYGYYPVPTSKWTGTPEEAAKMVRAAAHYFGSYNIGVIELDSDTRKLAQPKSTRFTDEDVAYQDATTYQKVIPNKYKWVIAYAIGQSAETTKRGLMSYHRGGCTMGYAMGQLVRHRLQRFIKFLGYESAYVSDMNNIGLGVLSGVGELCRNTNDLTPEYGLAMRYSPGIATDLPLAPTKPIDAGTFRFCKDCKVCAETCNEANGQTGLSLETEPTWEIDGPYNRVGVKAYQIAHGRCNWCPYCTGSCPFTQHNISPIHNVVKATVATTAVFNSFFANMHTTFGYGTHGDEKYFEDWWDRDLNKWEYGVNLCGAG
jgi:reductive dehalogenase